MPHEIVISMEGGLIQDIDGSPHDVIIRARDYDVEGADESELSRDADGDPYYETVWTCEDACQVPDG
jgi:hypothetical protein